MITKYIKYLLILCCLTFGCKKRPFDFRNKFVGTWTFDYSIENCIYSSNPPCKTETGQHTGKVYYLVNVDPKDLLRVDFSPSISSTFRIDKNGNILSGCVNGKFDNKEHVEFIVNGKVGCTLSLGSSYSFTVSGTKKSKHL